MENIINLIDSSDFTEHPVYLALDQFQGEEHLTNIIKKYQRKMLIEALGEIEYAKLLVDCDIDGVPQSQKYTDLFEGKTFEYENNNYVFLGFKHVLKHFIFYYFIKDVVLKTHLLGNVLANVPELELQTYSYKVTEVWNIGVELWDVQKNSLKNYLAAEKANFSDLEFSEQHNINALGI
jgi:hypothetical protein